MPAAQFTVAGKVILLILIQIGGLGIIACTTAFLILVGKRINMKERVVIQEAYGLSTLQGMIRFIERVLWGTFLVEGIGAIGYSLQFIRSMVLRRESSIPCFTQSLHFVMRV